MSIKHPEHTNSSLDKNKIENKNQTSSHEQFPKNAKLETQAKLVEAADREKAENILDKLSSPIDERKNTYKLITNSDISTSNHRIADRPADVQANIISSAENIHKIADGHDKNPVANKIQSWIKSLLS
ncbi:hypothetical protein AGMMS50249_2470 [candidate division SR1 bacterium]|nr:hypothetical protein AGMMS50249_2470 [candidate division SR1 bacterium]